MTLELLAVGSSRIAKTPFGERWRMPPYARCFYAPKSWFQQANAKANDDSQERRGGVLAPFLASLGLLKDFLTALQTP